MSGSAPIGGWNAHALAGAANGSSLRPSATARSTPATLASDTFLPTTLWEILRTLPTWL